MSPKTDEQFKFFPSYEKKKENTLSSEDRRSQLNIEKDPYLEQKTSKFMKPFLSFLHLLYICRMLIAKRGGKKLKKLRVLEK